MSLFAQIPASFLPMVTSSLNVGMALGAYLGTVPFARSDYPGKAIAIWFDGFFKPGLTAICTLSALTLGTAAMNLRSLGSVDARKRKSARWALTGVVFTLIHFGFGSTVRLPLSG